MLGAGGSLDRFFQLHFLTIGCFQHLSSSCNGRLGEESASTELTDNTRLLKFLFKTLERFINTFVFLDLDYDHYFCLFMNIKNCKGSKWHANRQTKATKFFYLLCYLGISCISGIGGMAGGATKPLPFFTFSSFTSNTKLV